MRLWLVVINTKNLCEKKIERDSKCIPRIRRSRHVTRMYIISMCATTKPAAITMDIVMLAKIPITATRATLICQISKLRLALMKIWEWFSKWIQALWIWGPISLDAIPPPLPDRIRMNRKASVYHQSVEGMCHFTSNIYVYKCMYILLNPFRNVTEQIISDLDKKIYE